MGIEITTQLIHASYASVIREIDANANIYDNPNQQGTYYPAWFIVHRSPVELQKGIGRWTLVYQIDIWYMLKSNQTRLYDQYSAIAEQLDDKLEYLPIFGTDACVHVLDRSWGLELDALKYSTTLRLYASRGPKPVIPYMEVIEDLRVFLKNQKVEFCTLSFTNDEHPDFSVDLPEDIVASVNSFVKLPFVSGEHEEEGELWIPNEWDIGAFGQPVKMANDITANLLWSIKPKYTLRFENTDHPQFDVELPEPITDYQGEEITLPTVAHQEFEDDGYVYWPLQWDIGAFGSKYVLNQNTDANLLWQSLKLVTITFANPDHPSFAINLPLPITVRPGESVTLPSVTGEWTEGGVTYTPSQWDIGAFGDSYTLEADTVANLMFEEVQSYEEITLYTENNVKNTQNSVTSGFTGNVSSGLWALYTDSGLTTRWAGYDYSNDYEVGHYVDGVWTPYINNVVDMPATTSGTRVTGRRLLDTGELWMFTNLTSSTTLNPGSAIVRIYPKGQQYYAFYLSTSSVYNNSSVSNGSIGGLKGKPGISSAQTVPWDVNDATLPTRTIYKLLGSAGNEISKSGVDWRDPSLGFKLYQIVNSSGASISLRAVVFSLSVPTLYAYTSTNGTNVSVGFTRCLLFNQNGYGIHYGHSFKYRVIGIFKAKGDASSSAFNTVSSFKLSPRSDGSLSVATSGSSLSVYKVWYIRTQYSETVTVYFTTAGASGTKDKYLSNTTTQTLYDENGDTVPYDATKTYTSICLIKFDGSYDETNIDPDFAFNFSSYSTDILKGRANGSRYAFKMIVGIE